MTNDRPDGREGAARGRAMTAIALSILLSVLDYAVANVALPTLAHDLHSTPSASIWVVNAYQLASLIALLPVAALGEILGAARLCRIGLIVFIGASALCALSHSLPELAAARALQGLGGACIMGVNLALVRFIYPASQLGRGVALNGLVIATGVALGPSVASAVLSVAPWPFLFWINLPLGAAALWLAFGSLPDHAAASIGSGSAATGSAVAAVAAAASASASSLVSPSGGENLTPAMTSYRPPPR